MPVIHGSLDEIAILAIRNVVSSLVETSDNVTKYSGPFYVEKFSFGKIFAIVMIPPIRKFLKFNGINEKANELFVNVRFAMYYDLHFYSPSKRSSNIS